MAKSKKAAPKTEVQSPSALHRRRTLLGKVVSDKMDKTIVVRMDRAKKNPKYGKRYIASKKYKVHDEKNQYKEGDKVVFAECRPISKDKRWRVIYNTK